jgi:hypothetical protein
MDSLKNGNEQLLETIFAADDKLRSANQHTLVLIEKVENAMTEYCHLHPGDTVSRVLR